MARYGRLLTDAQWEKIRPLLGETTETLKRGTTACRRPQSAAGHLVDSVRRGSLV